MGGEWCFWVHGFLADSGIMSYANCFGDYHPPHSTFGVSWEMLSMPHGIFS